MQMQVCSINQLVAWQRETSRYYVYQWQALGAYTRSLDTYFL